MKKVVLAFALLFGSLCIASAAVTDNDRIPYDKLPTAARTFIEKTFPGVNAVKCEKEKGWTQYDVRLSNGVEIEFDRAGNWLEIESNNGPFTMMMLNLLPSKAVNYINTNFNGQGVKKVERKRNGYEVKVMTNPKTEVKFDKNGNFSSQKIDD
ncbi:PepSY-like domain-containing protein [Coprobacter tertius]|uniref:PepSY-like domain-containing protein n=1 Tax=Coprobacter tertius TaxID=2944915 RepID=A0ABT1MJE5_9BACT|nr:PepSY-like domain-containing protein [Coprobacter tertius]MCP9612732.1 PepSY-like domain-containing protein [Coprobacter tertius]